MKQKIKTIVAQAVKIAHQSGALPSAAFPKIEVEEPKVTAHGDFSSNIALVSARIQKMAPRKIAEIVLAHLQDTDEILAGTEIAGPGFINFFIVPQAWPPLLETIHSEDDAYGASTIGNGETVQVEFVSSNPTGPLHVGHGRGAAVGDAVANLLKFCGFTVQKEYYINDSGRQIQTLGRSVYLRLKALTGETSDFPEDCYQGSYITDYAAELLKTDKAAAGGPDEATATAYCARYAAKKIIAGIRRDLLSFGVEFDNWFSEQSLYDGGLVDSAIDYFQSRDLVYEKEGAQWFKTSAFGDEKDRVVVRQNGQTTYFASDIAYHREKFERGFDRIIDVWGADHHGYIPRMKAAVEASGRDRNRFEVILVQLVNLLRNGQPVAMSTRAGEFVTLKDVVDEVGADAARFIFLTRHYDSPLDFDLELAKKKSNDNPVYYVQYVHARICSIIRKGAENGIAGVAGSREAADLLTTPEEIHLIKSLSRYPEMIENSALLREPHRITYFLMDLAAAFHAYYNKHRVLTDDPKLTAGRLYLVLAVQKVIRNGLKLLGVSAPDRM